MPVAALLLAARPVGPGDQVRFAGRDLLVAAGAAVGLRGGLAGERTHLPVAVGPLLHPVVAAREGGRGPVGPPAPGAARAHGRGKARTPAVTSWSSSGAGAKAGSRYSAYSARSPSRTVSRPMDSRVSNGPAG